MEQLDDNGIPVSPLPSKVCIEELSITVRKMVERFRCCTDVGATA